MKIPTSPECDHALIRSLIHLNDYDLIDRLQKSPTDGKYFTALFCRYSPVVYSLIRHSARSPVQADYLFALTWRHILNELSGIDLPSGSTTEFSLQGWLIGLTAAHINQAVLPEVADIHYVLQDAPPPLWCYTERALDSLLPRHRLIVLMAQTFAWSDTRIAAYLQAEGEQISASEVHTALQTAYQALERAIPQDVRAIYLDRAPLFAPSVNQEMADREMTREISLESLEIAPMRAGLMTIEFSEVDLPIS